MGNKKPTQFMLDREIQTVRCLVEALPKRQELTLEPLDTSSFPVVCRIRGRPQS